MSTKKSQVARKIRSARIDANLSQKQLSNSLSVSEKAVSSYEAGRTTPPLETLKQIARKTNKPVTYFTGESGVEVDVMTRLIKIQKEINEIKQILGKYKTQ